MTQVRRKNGTDSAKVPETIKNSNQSLKSNRILKRSLFWEQFYGSGFNERVKVGNAYYIEKGLSMTDHM